MQQATVKAESNTRLLGRATKLHHIGLAVSSLKTSTAFYQKLFGFPPLSTLVEDMAFGFVHRGYLLTMEEKPKHEAGFITHYSISVDGFEVKRDSESVKAAGFEGVIVEVFGKHYESISVPDPDRVMVQVIETNWPTPASMGIPKGDLVMPTPADALFSFSRVDHVNVKTADLDKSVAFYQKLYDLGSIRPLPSGKGKCFGFDFNGHMLSLEVAPKDEAGRITYYAVAVENFNRDKALAALKAANIKIKDESLDAARPWITVVDPDGIDVRIQDKGYHTT